MSHLFKYVAIVAVLCVGVLLVQVDCGKVTTTEDVEATTASSRPRESVIKESVSVDEQQRINSDRVKDLPSTEWKFLKRSKYLTYLFRKYGSGGVITFEVCQYQRYKYWDSFSNL